MGAVAAALPAGAAAVPNHIETWAYDDGCNGGVNAGPALVDVWVTFAESNCGPDLGETKALSDCSHGGVNYCVPVAYLDPEWIYAHGSVPLPASEPQSWWLHEPDAREHGRLVRRYARLRSPAYGGGYVLDQDTAAVRRWFTQYVERNLSFYSALMADDTGGNLSSLLYDTRDGSRPFRTSYEIRTDAALQRSHEAMAAAMVHAGGSPFDQIDNGITPNPNLATPFPMLENPSTVRGLVAEGAPVFDGQLTSFYSTLLDELAYVDNSFSTTAGFIVLLSYDTSGAVRSRWLQEATVMLGYSPGHVVDWADLETRSSDLAAWPEEGLVPAEPVQSMRLPAGRGCLAGDGAVCSTGGHTGLRPRKAPAGVYVREFRECYNQGVLFGSCAAVVNDTRRAVTMRDDWFVQPYAWEMSVNVPAGTSGDVQSGGTLIPDGRQLDGADRRIAADSAVLLAGTTTSVQPLAEPFIGLQWVAAPVVVPAAAETPTTVPAASPALPTGL